MTITTYSFTTNDERWYLEVYKNSEHSAIKFVAVQYDVTDDPQDMVKNEEFCIQGYVKFDGCMNWNTSGGMQLFCGKEHVESLSDMFNELYEFCGQFFDSEFYN